MSEPSVQEGLVVGGDFRLQKPLGAGGMGAVFRAEQLSTGKLRAVKIMHARFSDDPIQRARFTQEARVAASVASAHVVEIIAAGVAEESGIPWIAMELLEGEDLTAHVKRLGPLTLGAVSRIVEQLCHGLGEAHDRGIVHRDLKPHNVFITESHNASAERMVKVLDFGIAKLIAESTMSTTAALGSPAWMAPEQTEASPLISAAADVWSLGLVTFWLLTARPFWRAANHRDGSLQAVLREMVIDAIPVGSERARQLGSEDLWPPVLDAWLARCLERDPRRRFADARAAHAAFVDVLDGKDLDPLEAPAVAEALLGDAEASTHRAPNLLDEEGDAPLAETSNDDASPSGPASAPTVATVTQVSVTPEAPPRTDGEGAGKGDPSLEIDRTASPLTRRDVPTPVRRVGSWFVGAALLLGIGVWAGLATREPTSLDASSPGQLPLDDTSATDRFSDDLATAPAATTGAASATSTKEANAAAADQAAAEEGAAVHDEVAADEAAPAVSASPWSETLSSSAAPRAAVPVPAARRPAPSSGNGLPPFDAVAAHAQIRAAQKHAAGACAQLEGPRSFGASLVYSPHGSLMIGGQFPGASGACVKSTLGMARMGPFGPEGAKSQTFATSVMLPPLE